MQTGTKISALAHGLLLGWAFLGGAFRSDPLPFEVQDVSVISAEEFALMTGQSRTPEVDAVLDEPEPPAPTELPDVTAEPDSPPPRSQPEAAPDPVPEPLPETVPDPVPPEPEARPDPLPDPVPPEPETAALVPETPAPPQRPSERIAPEPVAPPPPEARPDPVEREEVAPARQADSTREAQQATAPEEAATEIVTEAEQTAVLAPTRSPRPAPRPSRPAPAPASETPAAPATEDAVAAALAEALGETRAPATPAAPSGPPLSAGEKEALRVAVSSCWNVGSLSSEALATTVVVAVSLSRDGKPQMETIRLMSSSGGGDGAAKQAFEAARRAIIRCGARGFNLPVEKFDHWRDIEMTFNPERMRIK